jgi:hypothetical protein
MKFLINPIFRISLILGTWFFCFRKVYLEFTHTHFLDFALPLLIFLAGVISLVSFLIDYGRYKTHKKVSFFLPTLVTVLCISGLFGFDQYLKHQDKTPTVLYASKVYSGLSTISIDFRENGTYRCEKGGLFGDTYYTRGRYTIKDSIIQLDKSNLYDLVKTDRLRMMTIPKNVKVQKGNLLTLLFASSSKPDTLPETFLFQLDQKNDTIPSALVLRVNNNVIGYRD